LTNILAIYMNQYSLKKTPLEVLLSTAEKVKMLRKAHKYSQAELAERSGVSLGSLKRFENTGQISLESLVKIANIFDRLNDFEAFLKSEKDLKNIEKLFSK
jgi:transcriptional regulator with XRE-family HTH domain